MKLITSFTVLLLISGLSSPGQAITGSGTASYVPKFTGTSILSNGSIYDNGTNVGLGNATPAYKLDVTGTGRFSNDLLVNNLTIGLGSGNILSNTVIGYQAGKINTTGLQNIYFGYQAGTANTTGYQNNFIGYQAGMANTTGNVNTFIGYFAGLSNTTGINNNFLGNQAGVGNVSGNNNNIFGSASGININTGSNNIIIGHYSGGGITTGSNNTIIGSNLSGLSATLTNNIIIADGGGNRRINVDATGNVGIGTITPFAALDVGGTFHTTLNTQALPLSNGAGGLSVNWNRSNGGAEVNLWNVFNNSPISFQFSQKTGTSTFADLLTIMGNGNVAIGTTDTKGYKFAVNGSAVFTKAVVKLSANWPDYVFQDNYELLPLPDLKEFLDKNKHLPEMPSASEVEKNGIDLGGNQAMLLKKIEELTLHVIALNKNCLELNRKVQTLSKDNEALKKNFKHVIR